MRKISIILGFFLLFAARTSLAQVIATIKQNNVAVKSEPNFSSETLLVVRAGTRLTVKGRNGAWFKVSVMKSNFEFTGWVEKSAFLSGFASAPAPTPTPAPSSLDQFFESPGSTPPQRQPSAPSRPSSDSSSFSSSSRKTGSFMDVWLAEKLRLLAGLDFAFFQHSASSATGGTLFSYSLTGVGINLLSQYDYWYSANKSWFASAQLGYTQAFYLSKTNLKDTSGNAFSTRSTRSTGNDISLKTSLNYNMSPTLKLGTSLGFKLLKFNGDDIKDNSGAPLNLYVSTSQYAFPLGLFATYTHQQKYEASLGIDLLLLNSLSESPIGATGTNPSAKIGINPYLTAMYIYSPVQQFGLMYDLLFQSVSYTGSGNRVTLAITDGSTSTKIHQIGLLYRYKF